VSKNLDQVETFLLELAAGLEALGPAETEEVLAEVRSHLVEAIVEANGDEAKAVAEFGDADVLAERILEERHVLVSESRVPRASEGRRVTALVIDVVLWLFALGIFLSPVWWATGERHSINPGWLALACVYGAAVIAVTAWWWLGPWKRRGFVSAGMHVMGVQRVRIGDATRLVRARDIAGSRTWSVSRGIAALIVVVFLATLGYAWFQALLLQPRRDQETAIQVAVTQSSNAVQFVTTTYMQVMEGASTAEIQQSFSTDAGSAAANLVNRRATGQLDFYAIDRVQLPDFEWPVDFAEGIPSRSIAVVMVTESASNQSRRAQFEYRVDVGTQGPPIIESVQPWGY
jgi:hypothetical protein